VKAKAIASGISGRFWNDENLIWLPRDQTSLHLAIQAERMGQLTVDLSDGRVRLDKARKLCENSPEISVEYLVTE